MEGWTAFCHGHRTGVPWSKLGARKSNVKVVHLQMDKTVALSCIQKMKGTLNRALLDLAQDIWDYLTRNGIMTIVNIYLTCSI